MTFRAGTWSSLLSSRRIPPDLKASIIGPMISRSTHAGPGIVDYSRAQAAQRLLAERRRAGKLPDLLWLLEHPPTITWGSAGGSGHSLFPREELARRGYQLVASERGGDATCHEPGQLVAYPIVSLEGHLGRDLHDYLRRLEEALIQLLRSLGLESARWPGRTGVWLLDEPSRKIAAIGVRAKGWVASHGFALNVHNTLEGFGLIVPCGLRDAGVTSLARELGPGAVPPWGEIENLVHRAVEDALGLELRLLRGLEGIELAGEA